ncbi:hypothetical protein [Laspinema sp. D2d]|nr:hypothetical protein [Laspinema sp. D2d]
MTRVDMAPFGDSSFVERQLESFLGEMSRAIGKGGISLTGV